MDEPEVPDAEPDLGDLPTVAAPSVWTQVGGRPPSLGGDLLHEAETVVDSPGTAEGKRGRTPVPLHADRRYEVQEEVGRGGMGAVYRALDHDLGRPVAMKVLLAAVPGTTGRDGALAEPLVRFLDEAQVTAQLQHPGIVPVHELGFDADGRAFYTMPLLRGRRLEEIFDLARRGQVMQLARFSSPSTR